MQNSGQSDIDWPNRTALSARKLGILYDTWADVIDDEGAKASRLRKLFQARMAKRQIPKVNFYIRPIEDGGWLTGRLRKESRRYFFATTATGAVATARIAEVGNDLYLSFNVYQKKVINPLIAASILACLLVALIFLPIAKFLSLVLVVIAILVPITVLILGVAEGKPTSYFFRRLSLHDLEDIRAVTITLYSTLAEICEVGGIKRALKPKDSFAVTSKSRGI